MVIYYSVSIIFMVNFYSKLINYPLSSYSCTSSYFDVTRWLWALPECQAGETFDVACPTTCIAEEFKREKLKGTTRTNGRKVTKRINSRICMGNAPTDRLVKPWKKKDRMLAGWLLILCWSMPCCAALDATIGLPWLQAPNAPALWIVCGKWHRSV